MLTPNEILDIQLRNKGNADVNRLLNLNEDQAKELKGLRDFASLVRAEIVALREHCKDRLQSKFVLDVSRDLDAAEAKHDAILPDAKF